jgi:hypothetical protein
MEGKRERMEGGRELLLLVQGPRGLRTADLACAEREAGREEVGGGGGGGGHGLQRGEGGLCRYG